MQSSNNKKNTLKPVGTENLFSNFLDISILSLSSIIIELQPSTHYTPILKLLQLTHGVYNYKKNQDVGLDSNHISNCSPSLIKQNSQL